MQDFLKIHDNDNVIVALNTLPAGTEVVVSGTGTSGEAVEVKVTAVEEIPAGHKMAICDILEGGEVIKYGYRIGNAKEEIQTVLKRYLEKIVLYFYKRSLKK